MLFEPDNNESEDEVCTSTTTILHLHLFTLKGKCGGIGTMAKACLAETKLNRLTYNDILIIYFLTRVLLMLLCSFGPQYLRKDVHKNNGGKTNQIE